MKTPPFQIQFGAISPPLKKQIRDQKLSPSINIDITQWQRLADAITLLKIQGMITGPQTIAARHRLVRRMSKYLKPRK